MTLCNWCRTEDETGERDETQTIGLEIGEECERCGAARPTRHDTP